MNNQTQEALKMAIEDAMKFVNTLNGYEDANQSKPFKTEADKYLSYASVVIKSLATSLKEALAQPAQEPVLPFQRWSKEKEMIESWQQSAQEPVAWMSKKRGDVSKAKMYFNEGEEILPLYTHPAPSCQECENLKHDLEGYMDANKELINREWQGLSDDEIDDISICEQISPDRLWHIYVAIEQALKEKNT